jgi:hypothetical protein
MKHVVNETIIAEVIQELKLNLEDLKSIRDLSRRVRDRDFSRMMKAKEYSDQAAERDAEKYRMLFDANRAVYEESEKEYSVAIKRVATHEQTIALMEAQIKAFKGMSLILPENLTKKDDDEGFN